MTQDWIGQDSPSVADVQAFEALPLDVRAIARRVLLFEQYPEEVVEEWIWSDVEAARREERQKVASVTDEKVSRAKGVLSAQQYMMSDEAMRAVLTDFVSQ